MWDRVTAFYCCHASHRIHRVHTHTHTHTHARTHTHTPTHTHTHHFPCSCTQFIFGGRTVERGMYSPIRNVNQLWVFLKNPVMARSVSSLFSTLCSYSPKMHCPPTPHLV